MNENNCEFDKKTSRRTALYKLLGFSVFDNEYQNYKSRNHGNGIGYNHRQTPNENTIDQPANDPHRKSENVVSEKAETSLVFQVL